MKVEAWSKRANRIALVVMFMLVASACGTDPDADARRAYLDEASRLTRQLALSSDALQSASTTPEAMVGAADQHAGRIADVAADLDDLEPPPDLKQEHERLVRAMEQMAEAAEAMGDAGRAIDVDAKRRAVDSFREAAGDAMKAQDQMTSSP